MLVPEHNPNGEPGGPFNIFDIGFVDPVNRTYVITDRIGLDVPVFSTVSDIAQWVIGGDNTVAENGNDASPCWSGGGLTIPPTMSGMGNYTRFGCKTLTYHLSGSGANGNFGGFLGGQCCASRANNLNPLTGPNGLEVSGDGNFAFISNGSATLFVFDMAPLIKSGFKNSTQPAPAPQAPVVVAAIPTGTSPDYDGPNGIGPCAASANGRAFSDPTCGDLRADELATTGGVVHFPQDGSDRFLVAIINGDPGNAFISIIDATGVVTRSTDPVKAHCLPYNSQAAFSPGPVTGAPAAVLATMLPANYSTCIMGQIYYDFAPQNNIDTIIDDAGANAGTNPCPNPSVVYLGQNPNGTPNPNIPGVPVPSGASGHAAGGASLNPDIACHHGPTLTFSSANAGTGQGGKFCAPGVGTPAGCVGSGAPAGLGGLTYYPPTHTFLATNGNSTPDLTVGSVDVIDPLHAVTVGGVTKYVPVVVNSFPIYNCMPTGLSLGPGTDVLVSCADHDGRAFAPSTVIINGTTGAVVSTFNQIGFSDQTWYNPGDNRYYVAGRDMPTGPRLGVIDAGTRTWLQNVPTNGNAHSVAADPINNHIFVPLPAGGNNCQSIAADGCVGVYGAQ